MSAGARNVVVALIALAGVMATIGLFVFAARDNLIKAEAGDGRDNSRNRRRSEPSSDVLAS